MVHASGPKARCGRSPNGTEDAGMWIQGKRDIETRGAGRVPPTGDAKCGPPDVPSSGAALGPAANSVPTMVVRASKEVTTLLVSDAEAARPRHPAGFGGHSG